MKGEIVMNEDRAAVPAERIENCILLVRGLKVMLDKDLAALYDVETRALVQAVKRNIVRFPSDFMFQLTEEENVALRSQTVILKTGRGKHRKYLSDSNDETELSENGDMVFTACGLAGRRRAH